MKRIFAITKQRFARSLAKYIWNTVERPLNYKSLIRFKRVSRSDMQLGKVINGYYEPLEIEGNNWTAIMY